MDLVIDCKKFSNAEVRQKKISICHLLFFFPL